MIHTVKGFGIVNKAEVDVFLELSCFFNDPTDQIRSDQSLSHVRLFVTPRTAAYQAPPSMGFSRQEYWSGVPLPSPLKHLPLLYWLCQSLSLRGSQQTVKIFQRDGNSQTTLPASWETCMQVKKQQVEPDMKQWTGSKLGKEYIEAMYCHPAYLTSMQSISLEIPSWMKHKLELIARRNINNLRYAGDTILMQKAKRN